MAHQLNAKNKASNGKADARKRSILFVCTGNICRSPLAHRMFERMARERGAAAQFEVDSCGTGAWHAGENADERMRELAKSRGWTLDKKSRRITREDCARFDHIIVMDRGHLRELEAMMRGDAAGFAKVALLRSFDPRATGNADMDVPDPYYGGDAGFERVYDMVERSCAAMLDAFLARE